ncbi:MAG: glycerol-3-phosphate 1-O-acyltransferase PlsY [Oscillospiraceae bacterium]|nr:glycerol-3-phosphate 1-O-acyltransferase PlsY [Oscillospiraceae bacterium]
MLIRILLVVVIGYLLGGCNGAILVSKLFLHEDVRSHGSGNAGLTNFFRSYGGKLTFLVILVDVAKAVLACLVGAWLLGTDAGKMLGGLSATLGHEFPVFYGFRGGKGILCGVSVAAAMDWRIALILIVFFGILVGATRYVSLGSVLSACIYPFLYLIFFWGDWWVFVLSAVLAISAIVMHRGNIQRLLQGTERKLSFRKKS